LRALKKEFQRLAKQGDGALIAYVTAGDPKPAYTLRIADTLIDGGADILELGVPFSDPIADPTIQAATVRALEAGTTPEISLEIVRKIKQKHDVPVVILTYYNQIFRLGVDNYAELARRCTVDGIIVPDLPVEEAGYLKNEFEKREIDTIFFTAPSTSNERLSKIVDFTSGFLYLISIYGVTGVRKNLRNSTIQRIKSSLMYTKGKIPLAVGFGISKPKQVTEIIQCGSDGAIVGSAFVEIIQRYQGNISKMLERLHKKARKLKEATIGAHPEN
jgi:tryptophan synthase alpha chain